jgi:hypothetical protein
MIFNRAISGGAQDAGNFLELEAGAIDPEPNDRLMATATRLDVNTRCACVVRVQDDLVRGATGPFISRGRLRPRYNQQDHPRR